MKAQPLIDYFNKFLPLDEEEKSAVEEYFKEKKVRRRQFILQEGDTSKYNTFVVEGCFKMYFVDEKGKEHIIQFAIENWWASDFNSYIYQHPATLYIVALEDSVILQLEYEKEQELKRINHKFETFFRIMAEKGLAFEHRRIIFNLTHSAEARYENFLLNYPNLVQRVPQYALASYLGMTPVFLSKIRNKAARKS